MEVHNATETWWLKHARAAKHLEDIQADLAPLAVPTEHTVLRTHGPDGEATLYEYRISIDSEGLEDLPLKIGDFLSNCRAALDHAVVARVPSSRARMAQFPIFTDDIWRTGPDGIPLPSVERRFAKWSDFTEGMTSEVLAVVRRHQPGLTPQPKEHVFAVLQDLQNADKHRQMVFVTKGLMHPVGFGLSEDGEQWTFDSEDVPPNYMLGHQGLIFRTPKRLEVHVIGPVSVGVSTIDGGSRQWPLPLTLEMIRDVTRQVLEEMDSAADLHGA